MSNQTQQQIDTLIQIINDAEEPGTVTNLIVAAVLAFLADKVKTMATASALSAEVSALETVDASLNQAIQNEATARQAADTTLSDRISALQVALDRLMSGNVSDAIESFNEVISFLEEVTDDESLTGLLTAIDNRLNGVDEDLENKAGLHSNTGKVIYGQMPDVVLASMGFNLDNINAPSGTGIQYVPSYGDYYFDTNDNHIKYVDTGAIRDLNKPEPGLIYCNMKTNLTYRWIGSSWQPVGSSSNVDVVNGLNSTDGTKALSAAQGNVLKLKINEVYQALQSVYSLLGCAAFWGEKSPVTTVLPDLNWNSTMFTVTINKVNSNIAVKRGGIPVTGSSFQAEEGTSVTLTFEGSNTYEVLSVTVNGTAVQKVNGVFTYSIVVNGNTSLEINGTGNTITAPITVTKTLNGCTVSDETAAPSEGGSYSAKITPPSGKFISNIQATMDNGNGGTTQLTVTELNDGSYANNSYMIESSNITGNITIVANTENVMLVGSIYYENTNNDIVTNHSTGQRMIPFVAIPSGTTNILYVFGKYSHGNNEYGIAFYNSSKERQGFLNARNTTGAVGYRVATAANIDGAIYLRASFETSTDGIPEYGSSPILPGIYASGDNGATWTNIFDASSFVPDSSVQGE